MNFNSLAFLLYLPVVVGVHWPLPHRLRWVWLLGASAFFYMYWQPALIVLLLITTLTSWAAALGITRYPRAKKPLLALTLVICLGILVWFKYAGFLADTLSRLTGWAHPAMQVLLPVGISFYTFQTLSYVIDVYRGDFPAEKHFGYYALFVVFFPQLVAGPIENPRNLLPQLRAERRCCRADVEAGLRLLLSGFFRKCVVADLCGIYVNTVFADAAEAGGLTLALAGALFCIQMYCDFAGYSEIAAASARLMGIRLMQNFNQPYLSQSYGEFFRRWHISLNQWFTQYLYIPLGGSRKGLPRKLLNTVMVFALCGLWHGASWTYVLWGLYAAFFVCLESLLKKPAGQIAAKLRIPLENPFVVLLRRSYMFLIFIPAALLFRAESVEQALLILRRLLTVPEGLSAAFAALGMNGTSLLMLLLTLLMMARLPAWTASASFAHRPAQTGVTAVMLTLCIALSWLALLATQDNAAFAYFQF